MRYFFRCFLIGLFCMIPGCKKVDGSSTQYFLQSTTTSLNKGFMDSDQFKDKTWIVQFSRGLPPYLPTGENNSYFFDFGVWNKNPLNSCNGDATCPVVSYIVKKVESLNAEKLTMKVNITMDGGAAFQYMLEPGNVCATPASVRFFFQRKGDNYELEHYRWWAKNAFLTLKPGSATVSVDLNPENFQSVYGKLGSLNPETIEAFNWAKEEAEHVGFTFGGGCFFGHGVNISQGNARFTLEEFLIE